MIGLDPNKASCGCPFSPRCTCPPVPPFTVVRTQLQRMNKMDLFTLYTRCINDEMSPIMWRGFTKSEALDMILEGKDSTELTPFI